MTVQSICIAVAQLVCNGVENFSVVVDRNKQTAYVAGIEVTEIDDRTKSFVD